MDKYKHTKFCYVVIASDRRERGNLTVKNEIASSLCSPQ